MRILRIFLISLTLATIIESFRLDSQQGFLEGDIIVPNTRATVPKTNRWPNAIIPYVISSNLGSNLIRRIEAAMADVSKYTCVRFVPRKREQDYVSVESGDSCSAYMGKGGGKQEITYNSGCADAGTVHHEVLHAVGLYHTQARKDRDQYLYVFTNNVEPDLVHNFEIKRDSETFGTPYNYLSVMHYLADSWSSNGLLTMFPKDPSYLYKIGTVDRPNDGDYELVRRLYDCPKTNYPKPPAQNMAQPPKCGDNDFNCASQKSRCMRDSSMIDRCRKTCNFCVPSGGQCKDTINNCSNSLDRCLSDPDVMTKCQKSCGLCDA